MSNQVIFGLLLMICSMALSSCFANYYKPPAVYWRGEGAYSEILGVDELRKADAAGRLKPIGHFFSSAFGCFAYTESLVESNVIIPAIERGLHDKFANAANHVKVIPGFEPNPLGLLFALFGCEHWSLEGEALWVKPS